MAPTILIFESLFLSSKKGCSSKIRASDKCKIVVQLYSQFLFTQWNCITGKDIFYLLFYKDIYSIRHFHFHKHSKGEEVCENYEKICNFTWKATG